MPDPKDTTIVKLGPKLKDVNIASKTKFWYETNPKTKKVTKHLITPMKNVDTGKPVVIYNTTPKATPSFNHSNYTGGPKHMDDVFNHTTGKPSTPAKNTSGKAVFKDKQ